MSIFRLILKILDLISFTQKEVLEVKQEQKVLEDGKKISEAFKNKDPKGLRDTFNSD